MKNLMKTEMKTTMKTSKLFYLTLSAAMLLGTSVLVSYSTPVFAQEEHADEAGEEHGEEGGSIVEMSAQDRAKNGVTTGYVKRQQMGNEISASGEIILNQYSTSQVTPRISAQVMKRFAKLGDHVKRGKPLVILTSVEMAEAQGAAIVAAREWARVKKLGKEVISERRYVEAQIAAQLAKAKIAAFGMTPSAIKSMLASGDATKATGTFTLYALQSGTVMKDDFVIGEIVDAGRELFEISDENKAWVNVRVPSDSAQNVKVGAPVSINVGNGDLANDWKSGKVLQLNHQIDEKTRTFTVRVEMDNAQDHAHAGQFVTVYLQAGTTEAVLVVPFEAVTSLEGKDIVFEVEGDELHPTPVELGVRRGSWVEIKNGIGENTEIATSQIFLLKSLILKSKMGSGHGH
jgi:membrane fusion protein, heavy metal efflux system